MPQSETARKLLRVLGRDPGAAAAVTTTVYVGYQNNVGGGGTDAAEYGRYVDAYNGYLEAINGVNATAAGQCRRAAVVGKAAKKKKR